MKTLIIYNSGVGNTKLIANILFHQLCNKIDTTIKSTEELTDMIRLDEFDNFIIGFPTYHATPSEHILAFLDKLEPLVEAKPVYIFTTCGLCSVNVLRIFAKKCMKKNLIPVLSRSFRCPATDGSLVAPIFKIWFQFEKNINLKISKEADRILEEFNKEQYTMKIPRFKLYSLINYPNKLGGKYLFKPNIYLHKSQCIKCGICVKDCPNNCYYIDNQHYPVFNKENCQHCYRCIHHCQAKALSLSKNRRVDKQLNGTFYNNIK